MDFYKILCRKVDPKSRELIGKQTTFWIYQNKICLVAMGDVKSAPRFGICPTGHEISRLKVFSRRIGYDGGTAWMVNQFVGDGVKMVAVD
jgi:hypothetical protein